MKVSEFVGKTIKEIAFEKPSSDGAYLMLIKFEDGDMIMTPTANTPFYTSKGDGVTDDIQRVSFMEFFKKFD